MRVVEFCCGYGGASAGLVAAGLEYEVGYDSWPMAVEAHRRWHPDLRTEIRDVRDVEPHELEGRFVWASLPCQPWSTANRRKRGRSHPHYYPLDHFAYQVHRAGVAVIENVPGLLTERDGQEELARLERACARLGLSLSIHLVPALWFGVPQLRRRAIIVIGGPLVLFAPPAVLGGAEGWAVTATEGKGGPGRVPALARTVRAAHGGGRDSRRYSQIIDPEADPYAPRTPEECARLQGVPHEPIAHLPKTHQYTLIGNAVPPRFAEGVVRVLMGALWEARQEREGNDPSRLRELRKEARAMRLERRLMGKHRL